MAVLGLSAGIAVISAHQEDAEAGLGIGIVGGLVLCAALWIVAWRRGAWRPANGRRQLGMALAGVVAVAAAGSTAVTDVVLAARGESVQVVVRQVRNTEIGYRIYTLAPLVESASLRGKLHTKRELSKYEAVTVLADPAGFVRPALPADVAAAPWVLIVLFGVGVLAVSVIGFGFPFEPTDDEGPTRE